MVVSRPSVFETVSVTVEPVPYSQETDPFFVMLREIRAAREQAGLRPHTREEIDAKVQESIIIKYRELHERLKQQGLFNCNYLAYGREVIRYCTLFALGGGGEELFRAGID